MNSKVFFLSAAFALTSVSMSSAETRAPEPLIGGQPIDFYYSPIAFIENVQGFSCSGLLVGPRAVLTAGHCVPKFGKVEDFGVGVGGNIYTVDEAWYHGQFVHEGDAFTTLPYDLGVLILSADVTSVAPVPIVTDLPIYKGLKATTIGFGTSESSNGSNLEAKAGDIILSKIASGYFESTFANSGVAVCSGDSGGPVLEVVADHIVVIGVNSSATTFDSNNICRVGGGESLFVDLQSAQVRPFLDEFSEINRISGKLLLLQQTALSIRTSITNLLRRSNPLSSKSSIKSLSKLANSLKSYQDSRRSALVKNVLTASSKLGKSKTAKDAKKQLTEMKKQIEKLIKTGIQ